MSLLAKQLQAIRQEKGIPEHRAGGRREVAPSLLFAQEEAALQDAETVAALALRGISNLVALEPDVGVYARLFEGPAPLRDMLTKEENGKLDADIRQLLLLVSPHLPIRAAQECVEGLLRRFQVHVWNVDDVLACALPYHDSPLFTRLLQSLSIEGKPKWAWLQKFKAGPLTLVRSALAKYCSKDLALLSFLGSTLQEVVKLQKSNRVLSGFFAALWLDVLSVVPALREDLVEAAMPTLVFVLRRPHLRDAFHAAITVASALSVKADLSVGIRSQLVERAARHAAAPGPEARAAFGLLALQAQQQDLAEVLTPKALKALATAGAEAVARAVPSGVDGANLLAAIVRAALLHRQGDDSEEEAIPALAGGLLMQERERGRYVGAVVESALSAYCEVPELQEHIASVLSEPLSALGNSHPLETSGAFERVVGAALEAKIDPEPVVNLMAPVCAPVGAKGAKAEGDEGASVPVLLAFSHKSGKVRRGALVKAVADLQACASDGEPAPRQKLLASLALRATQDADEDVVAEALQLKPLWGSLTQAKPELTVPCLEVLLRGLVARGKMGGGLGAASQSLKDAFAETVLHDTRASKLLPPALRCCAWVYAREDCSASQRRRLDSSILPLLVLVAVGLDSVADGNAGKELQAAFLEVASKFQHPLLSKFQKAKLPSAQAAAPASDKGPQLGPLAAALCAAADAGSVEGLCNILEGLAWESLDASELQAPPMQGTPLGGALGRSAAALLLAAVLPRYLGEASKESGDEVVARCARASERLAASGEADETLSHLVHALLRGISSLNQKRSSIGSPGKKKTKGAGATRCDPSLREAFASALRLVTEQPKRMSDAMRSALGSRSELLQPSLLQLALLPVPAGRPCAGASNALLLARSLVASGAAKSWVVDQSLLPCLMAQVATTESSEVRANVLGLLQAMRDINWAETERSWTSACAVALQDAGVLRGHGDVMTKGGWSAAAEKKMELAGMPPKTVQGFLDHMLAHKADIMRDSLAACSALARFLSGEGSKDKSARTGACAFWAVGLSMLAHPANSALLSALPVAAVLTALDEPLKRCAEEAGASLQTSASEFPAVLQVAAAKALEATAASGTPSAATVEAVGAFLSGVALPFIAAVRKCYESDKGLPHVSNDLIEFIRSLCRLLARVASGAAVAANQQDEAGSALVKLCIACSVTPQSQGTDEAEGSVQVSLSSRVPAAVREAFVAANLDARCVRRLLELEQLLEPKKQYSRADAGIKLFLPHISALTSAGLDGAGELCMALSGSATWIAKRLDKAGAADFLSNVLSALAALAEQISESGVLRAELDVSGACDALQSVCGAVGNTLSGTVLTATIRACVALASIMPALAPPKKDVTAALLSPAALPAPAQVCVSALGQVVGPLNADTLGLLRGGLFRMRRFPEAPPGQSESSESVAMRRDVLAQSRLRPLLCAVLMHGTKLVEDADVDVCRGLAQSVGLRASLDMALLLMLSRTDKDQPKKKRKKAQRKRKAAEDADVEMALDAEDGVDRGLALLNAVPMGCRYHCLGTLAQTLCALSCKLSGQTSNAKGLGPLWGPALLPEQLVAASTSEQLLTLLESGLTLAMRFVTEHGIPNDMDEEAIDTSGYRVSAPADEAAAEEGEAVPGVAALSMCYALKAACFSETILASASGGSGDVARLSACRSGSAQLRGLTMRSLAVNHPVTFLRAICFALRLPEFTPPAKLLAQASGGQEELQRAEDTTVLKGATQALREAREIREEQEEAAELDEEVEAACAPLSEAALRHVCGPLLSGASGDGGTELAVEAWRFLDCLCAASASSSPGPVLEVCLPAAAACLDAAATGGDEKLRVAVAACTCTETAVRRLGRGILDKLALLVKSLLGVLEALATDGAGDDSDERGEAASLQRGCFSTLGALAESVGAFMSPFLERILGLCTAPSPAWRTALLETLGRNLVAHVPHRLLLPAVQKATAAAAKAGEAASAAAGAAPTCWARELVALQRLAVLQIGILSTSAPEFVQAGAEASHGSLLKLAATGTLATGAYLRLGGRSEDLMVNLGMNREQCVLATGELPWSEHASSASVVELHALAGSAFAQFALRLSFDELRPRFGKALEWARGGRPKMLARRPNRGVPGAEETAGVERPGAEDACRALAIMALMRALIGEAPDIVEALLLPAAAQDVAACLSAARQQAVQLVQERTGVKKKRRAGLAVSRGRSADVLAECPWWWREVAAAALSLIAEALRQAGAGASQAKPVEEALDVLAEPCIAEQFIRGQPAVFAEGG
eukprot:TRINITY_DN3898_c0_g3_i1.p1 TRINITY_DN3898_c0_g3~~TRINITY_DN3898_c0_g3_i1.p1  ORF type:complete len:2298 (-),score=543.23 TRINITY_DN3898_c0_g3_i1:166-6987(-)